MASNKIRIKEKLDSENGRTFKIFIDGTEIFGITSLEYITSTDCVPTLTMSLIPFDIEVEMEELDE